MYISGWYILLFPINELLLISTKFNSFIFTFDCFVYFAQVQQKYESDEAIAHAISQKLGDTPGVSYSEIACKATECGRDELAIKVQFNQFLLFFF